MSLSNLIRKGGLAKVATVTPATIATQETEQVVTVAPVATVAVADIREPPTELSPDEESNIRKWLAHIGETDHDNSDELINQCRNNMQTRRYLLDRSVEVPVHFRSPPSVNCCDCVHFHRIDHPNLGHCSQGQPEAIAGNWDDDSRWCKEFSPYMKTNGEHYDKI